MNINYVLLFIVDKDQKFLLQHRDDTAPTYPGYWGFFGGAIEDNESPIEACRREACEEIRYRPLTETPDLITDYNDATTRCQGTKYYFIERCVEQPHLELCEGQEMKWFAMDELDAYLVSDYNRTKICELMKIAFGNGDG